ncbi:MAG: hypothetical protein PHT40_03050 [Patescibacteria group bacterium]|nr:hypothetical protein [Patescibacteria group bacterium]
MNNEDEKYTTNPGDYVVIQITGMIGTYIAEVIQTNPLRLKVEEEGPFARLKDGDFIISSRDTAKIQVDQKNNTNFFLKERHKQKIKIFSGLHSLSVKNGKLHEILPG